MIKIRTATENDLARILQLEKALIAPPWSSATLLSELTRNDTYFPLAIKNDSICGFAILRRVFDEGELFQIAVDHTMMYSGIGSLLLNAVLDCARESELLNIVLEVRRSNKPAIGLYQKFGFIKTGIRKNYYDQPIEDAIIMTRNLR